MRAYYRRAWRFANLLYRLLFGKHIYGRENIPSEGGILIACNHVSFWDPPLIGTASTRELHYLAKEELFHNRFLRWLITAHNAIPLRRAALSTTALKEAMAIVRSGGAVLIFPEGTRSKIGKLLPPKPGIGLLAVSTDAPIVPASILNSNHSIECMLRKRSVGIKFGKPFRVSDLKLDGSEDTSRGRYRRVGEEVMRRIELERQWLREKLGD